MKHLLLIISLLLFTACTTTLPLEMSSSEIQQLTNEDKLSLIDQTLVITKKDSTTFEAKVLSETDTSLVTSQGEIFYKDIQKLSIKKISKGKTAAAAGGLYLGVGLIGVFVIANAID